MPYTKAPAPCGTHAAYRRHLYHDQEPCGDCRKANNEQTKQHRWSVGMHKPYRPPRHGTYSGAQAHVARGEKPCDPCRLARNEYMRDLRRGKSAAKKGKRRTSIPDLICDVLETNGYAMTAEVLVEKVLDVDRAANRDTVRRTIYRLEGRGDLESLERLDEKVWRLTT